MHLRAGASARMATIRSGTTFLLRLGFRWLLVEVVVLSGLLGGVDVWWGDEPGGAVGHVDGPLFLVDEVVVVAAEEGAVFCAGGSVV